MKEFAGKVCFITGGASGAGFGQAQIFSEAGMKVVIADIRQDHIDNAAAHFKGKEAQVHFIKLDVTDREGWASAADETERVFGCAPELLILTAGVNTFGPVEASTFEDFDWVIGVNLFGVINGLVTFVPRMIKAGKGGYIATTVSGGAFGGAPIVAPYCASKAGVLNLLESYFLALKPYGIGVSALMPANIKSNIFDSALKSRPEHLKNTGYNVNDTTSQFLAGTHQYGIEPRELAERLKKGIEEGIFLIVPYPSAVRMVEMDFAEKWPLYASVEGMKELEERRTRPPTEEQKKIFFEREGYEMGKGGIRSGEAEDAGFAMAKKDIDWVSENKRAKS